MAQRKSQSRLELPPTSSGRLPAEVRQDLAARLARIEGHVRGIQRMLDEEETCDDLLIQLAAVRSATTQAIAQLLHSHLETCIAHCAANGSAPEAIAALEKALTTVLRQT